MRGGVASEGAMWIFPAEQLTGDQEPPRCPGLRCSELFEPRIGGWIPLL